MLSRAGDIGRSGREAARPSGPGYAACVSDLMPLTMYSTVWCGYCQRLKAQMQREGIAFVEVDIEHDDAAAAMVEDVNGGNQTVPTVQFPDGSFATNPSIAQVKERLGL